LSIHYQKNKKMKIKPFIFASLLFGTSITLFSCEKDPNDPGTEYSPNMYVPIAYDPFSQVADSMNKINPNGINMRNSARGTVARRNYATKYTDSTGTEVDLGLMVYKTHKDSIADAERTLKNPLPFDKKIIAEGKVLYSYNCQPCHGEGGKGDGLVGQKYAGVANLTSGAIAKYNGGHVFHVITHGKGRMWSHASQINALERWKIVQYIQVLQGQIDDKGNSLAKPEEAKDTKADAKDGKDAKATEKK
jgi:mono/diheme cytochrome c family protein